MQGFQMWKMGCFCRVWPILLCLVYRLKKNLKNDRGRDWDLLPRRNASESWKMIGGLLTHPQKMPLQRILRMPHVHLGFKSDGFVGTSQETMEICWEVPWYSIKPPRDVRDLENDRGRPNLPKTYRFYNKHSPWLIYIYHIFWYVWVHLYIHF